MVRRVKSKGTLEELESDVRDDLDIILDEKQEYRRQKRKEAEASRISELDTRYYFSVVFNNHDERQEWLRKYGLDNKMKCDYYILAEDFIL